MQPRYEVLGAFGDVLPVGRGERDLALLDLRSNREATI